MNTIAFFLAGAIVRFIDGSDGYVGKLKIPNGVRVVSLLGLCLGAWAVVLWPNPTCAWAGTWCALALIVGQTDWKDWLWQPMRFGLFGFAAVFPLGPDWWPVPLALALAGLTYPALFALNERVRLPTWGKIDGPEAYARMIAGGVCVAAPLFVG